MHSGVIMAHYISATQKDLLLVAIETTDARFIAQCVLNIQEILTCIKQLLDLDGFHKNIDHSLPPGEGKSLSSVYLHPIEVKSAVLETEYLVPFYSWYVISQYKNRAILLFSPSVRNQQRN